MSASNLQGLVALVTGAGRGTGRLVAQALAAQGATLAACDISPVNLEPVVDEINASGGRARAYVHDIAKKVDVQAMINDIVDDFGRIDLLVNCANVQFPAGLLEIDEWDLHRVFEVNAIGTLLVMQSVARVMKAQPAAAGVGGSGAIINVLKIPEGAPATFIASRAGLAAMTARVEAELSPAGVRVFCVQDEEPVKALLAICLNLRP